MEPAVRFASVPDEVFPHLRRRAIFECCKWDPQVGDVQTLSARSLMISRGSWRFLAESAEKLARETVAAEMELFFRPELHEALGLPRCVRRALRAALRRGFAIRPGRVIRFDFHLTEDGWRISEANTDVPGGFVESSGWTALVSPYHPGTATTGDPVEALARLVRSEAGADASVGLVHATAYTDDRQVMTFLARRFESVGLHCTLLDPSQIRWDDGRCARSETDWHRGPLDFVFRFFPAEWLPNLSRTEDWEPLFSASVTPVLNPASALLTQSKRFPLAWDRLTTGLDTWRALLPETRDPRDVDWRDGQDWVLKPSLGRVGESVSIREITSREEGERIAKWARRWPRHWAAQRRFRSLPMETDGQTGFACVGVFTIDGRAAGAYGRWSDRPLIDHTAREAAVLIADEVGGRENGGIERVEGSRAIGTLRGMGTA